MATDALHMKLTRDDITFHGKLYTTKVLYPDDLRTILQHIVDEGYVSHDVYEGQVNNVDREEIDAALDLCTKLKNEIDPHRFTYLKLIRCLCFNTNNHMIDSIDLTDSALQRASSLPYSSPPPPEIFERTTSVPLPQILSETQLETTCIVFISEDGDKQGLTFDMKGNYASVGTNLNPTYYIKDKTRGGYFCGLGLKVMGLDTESLISDINKLKEWKITDYSLLLNFNYRALRVYLEGGTELVLDDPNYRNLFIIIERVIDTMHSRAMGSLPPPVDQGQFTMSIDEDRNVVIGFHPFSELRTFTEHEYDTPCIYSEYPHGLDNKQKLRIVIDLSNGDYADLQIIDATQRITLRKQSEIIMACAEPIYGCTTNGCSACYPDDYAERMISFLRMITPPMIRFRGGYHKRRKKRSKTHKTHKTYRNRFMKNRKHRKKTMKRKSTKRKSTKRKSTKRKSTKRKSKRR